MKIIIQCIFVILHCLYSHDWITPKEYQELQKELTKEFDKL